jgi:signal transduction histidine kinase
MGIGLSISRTIIRSQGGELSVQSNGAEPGVTFTFFLPLSNEEHN